MRIDAGGEKKEQTIVLSFAGSIDRPIYPIRAIHLLTVPNGPGVAEALQYRVGLQHLLLDAGTKGSRPAPSIITTLPTTAIVVVQATATMSDGGRRHDMPVAGPDRTPDRARARMGRPVRPGGGRIDGLAEMAAHPGLLRCSSAIAAAAVTTTSSTSTTTTTVTVRHSR